MKLDLTPTVVEELTELSTSAEFELIAKRFQDSDQLGTDIEKTERSGKSFIHLSS
jgi:hypothetical protein